MLSSAMTWFTSFFSPSKDVNSKVPHLEDAALAYHDIYGRRIENGDYYFYRPEAAGFPVFRVEDILRKHQVMIEEIIERSAIGSHRNTQLRLETDDDYSSKNNGEVRAIQRRMTDVLFTDVIARYAEYVHMIPASEYDHHSQPGGLIYHSIEASLIAFTEAKNTTARSTGYIDIDNLMKPINQYAAWLLALVHDAGKVFTDIHVTAFKVFHKGVEVNASDLDLAVPKWEPQTESLIQWAKSHGVSSYQVNFVRNRVHNKHNLISSHIIDRIISREVKEYILARPSGRELMTNFHAILGRYTESSGYIESAIRKGDYTSTGRDARTMFDVARGEINKPPATIIVELMRRQLRHWTANEQNSQVWIINGDAFLRWSSSFDEISTLIKEKKLPVTRDVDVIVNILKDKNVVDDTLMTGQTYHFALGRVSERQLSQALLEGKSLDWVKLIKLRWPGYLYDGNPIPPSATGVFYIPDERVYFMVDTDGISEPYRINESGDLVRGENGSEKLIAKNKDVTSEGAAIESKHKNTDESESQAPISDDEADSTPEGKTADINPTDSTSSGSESVRAKLTGRKREKTSKADIALLAGSQKDSPKQKENPDTQQNKEMSEAGSAIETLRSDTDTTKARVEEETNSSSETNTPAIELESLHELTQYIITNKVSYIEHNKKHYVSLDGLRDSRDESIKEVTTWLRATNGIKVNISAAGSISTSIDGARYVELSHGVQTELKRYAETTQPAPDTNEQPTGDFSKTSENTKEPNPLQTKVSEGNCSGETTKSPSPTDNTLHGKHPVASSSTEKSPSKAEDDAGNTPIEDASKEKMYGGHPELLEALARMPELSYGQMLNELLGAGMPVETVWLMNDGFIYTNLTALRGFIEEHEVRKYRSITIERITARLAQRLRVEGVPDPQFIYRRVRLNGQRSILVAVEQEAVSKVDLFNE